MSKTSYKFLIYLLILIFTINPVFTLIINKKISSVVYAQDAVDLNLSNDKKDTINATSATNLAENFKSNLGFIKQDIVDFNLIEKKFNTYSLSQNLYLYFYDNSSLSNDSNYFQNWYKEILYDYIVRQKFVDFPFNYIISPDGTLYEGKSGGYDVQPDIDDLPIQLSSDQKTLASTDQKTAVNSKTTVDQKSLTKAPQGKVLVFIPTNLDNKSKVQALTNVQKIIDLYQIKNIYSLDFKVNNSTQDQPTKLLITQINEYKNQTLQTDKTNFVKRNYKLNFISADYSKEVNQNTNLEVIVKLKNESEFPLYNKMPNLFFLTSCSIKDKKITIKKSNFFESETWTTTSDVSGFKEDFILPNSEFTIKFKLNTPLLPNKYSENFCVRYAPDYFFTNINFKVDFSVKSTGLKLVKLNIKAYPYFSLRKEPNYNSEKLGHVLDNEIVILLETKQYWRKIKTKDGRTGWIMANYVKEKI